MSQGRDRKTRMERRTARRARQQSRRRARGTRALNTPKEMARVVPPTFPFRSCTRHIYEKIFEKDGVRRVLIALETDHGEEFPDALAAARESFSDLECEDVMQFFSLGVNDPFGGWKALNVPRARLPKAALHDITVCALHTHFQAFHTILCLFGRILAPQRWQQHGRETPLATRGRGAVGVSCREPPLLLMFEHDAADVDFCDSLAQVLCELFGVSFPSAESFSRRDERLI
ncbi:hypothetical protein B0H14DRAFT_2986016 [Mycena olivaceomarginata]|nr:hypothetical protein B0H14DRAFT_2986016 [Mycena olivaceomarginata]